MIEAKCNLRYNKFGRVGAELVLFRLYRFVRFTTSFYKSKRGYHHIIEYITIGVCIVVIFIISVVVILKSKRKATNGSAPSAVATDTSSRVRPMLLDTASEDFMIQVEMLPTETIGDERKLIEITDSRVLA